MDHYEENEISEQSLQSPEKKDRVICGFWRRICAFFIDGALLGIVGIAIGVIAYDFFAELGGGGIILGFIIAFLYYGILNSSIGNGQTIGKRLLKLQVVGKGMETISPAKSFLRFTVFGVPYFLNGAIIPSGITSHYIISLILGIIVFFGCASIVYLYLFNRITRQSLHDLVAGTYVIKIPHNQEVSLPQMWKGHYSVIGGIFVAVIVLITVATPKLTNKVFFSELAIVQKNIEKSGLVRATTVTAGTSSGDNYGSNPNYLENSNFSVDAVLIKRPENYDEVIRKIAAIVLNTYPKANSKNTINISVTYGFDIGIAKAWTRRSQSYSPQEWKELLSKNVQANKI